MKDCSEPSLSISKSVLLESARDCEEPMRKTLLYLMVCALTVMAFTSGAAAASGPQTAWITLTLPNPQVTPNWRNYAPADCSSDLETCAQDHRFWEEWDFSVFSNAIDASFKAVASEGKYQGVMMLMPLADSNNFRNNIQLVYQAAAKYGLAFEVALFPKWKYGAEWCYLYAEHAPPYCAIVPGTTTAEAYVQLLKMMDFVQKLSGSCSDKSYNRPFAIWYGWYEFSPGYDALKSFWVSLPAEGCNLQAAYITWLDQPFAGTPEVQQLQTWVKQRQRPYWVNTELYSTTALQQYQNTYAPYQTIITGVWNAPNIATWAQVMCGYWTTVAQPTRLGVWTFYDRDLAYQEYYRAYIDGGMAVAGQICSY
jgi:hypothetical protein